MIISAGLGRDSLTGCDFHLHPNRKEFYLKLYGSLGEVELSQKEFLLLEQQIEMIRKEFIDEAN